MELLGQLRWLRIVLASVGAWFGAFVAISAVVAVYAVRLGFEARGAPDQEKITAFAQSIGPWMGPLCAVLFVFGLGLLVARVPLHRLAHGVALGAVTSALELLASALFGGVGLGTLTTIAGYLAGGSLAGWLMSLRSEG